MSKNKKDKDVKVEETEVQEEEKEPVIETGVGKFFIDDHTFYDGEWRLYKGEKRREGKGILYYQNKDADGQGSEVYQGEWKNDKPDGQGTYKYTSGALYKGQWKNGLHHGQGTYEFPNGCYYIGEWKKQKMHGQGLYIDSKGKKWEGIFVDGVFQSKAQRKLRIQRVIRQKEEDILNESVAFFANFLKIYEECDKKQAKEALSPFFTDGHEENMAKFVNGESQVKFDSARPEIWEERCQFLQEQDFVQLLNTQRAKDAQYDDPDDDKTVQILKHPSQARVLDKETLACKQFVGVGQVVEFTRHTEEWQCKMAVLKAAEDQWIVVHYEEEREDDKKKKKKKK